MSDQRPGRIERANTWIEWAVPRVVLLISAIWAGLFHLGEVHSPDPFWVLIAVLALITLVLECLAGDADAEEQQPGRMHRIAGWAFMILLGPLHFSGEMVGPTGGTSWRLWAAAILGTILWAGVGLMVITHV